MTFTEIKRAMDLIEAVEDLSVELQRLMDPAPHYWEITRNNGDRLRVFGPTGEREGGSADYKIIKDAVVKVCKMKLKRWTNELKKMGVEI